MPEGIADTAGADWLPETVRAVVLVIHTELPWGAGAALELADRIGRGRRRTVLVNTIPGTSGPDSRLGADDAPGLVEAMLGRRTVGDVAVRAASRPFIYVPAGSEPLTMPQLVESAPFVHLVRAASRGGTLLLLARAADIEELAAHGVSERLGKLFDGTVQIGESLRPLEVPGLPPLLARVEAETPPPRGGPARPSGFTRPTSTPAIIARPAGEKGPVGRWETIMRSVRHIGLDRRLAGAVTLLLATIVAVWVAWQTLSPKPPTPPTLSFRGQRVSEPPSSTELEDGPSETSTEVPPAGEDDTASTTTQGVDLPYSVLVASYVRWGDAIDRLRVFREDDDMAFISPTVIGDRVYYRVFAGAVEDRLQAGDLMRSLVARKIKERERAWDMRPVALAFSLGDFGSEREATAERDRLHESGLPAYVLPIEGPDGLRYRLYSGAFESEAAAAALDSILAAAGRPAPLEIRRGVSR